MATAMEDSVITTSLTFPWIVPTSAETRYSISKDDLATLCLHSTWFFEAQVKSFAAGDGGDIDTVLTEELAKSLEEEPMCLPFPADIDLCGDAPDAVLKQLVALLRLGILDESSVILEQYTLSVPFAMQCFLSLVTHRVFDSDATKDFLMVLGVVNPERATDERKFLRDATLFKHLHVDMAPFQEALKKRVQDSDLQLLVVDRLPADTPDTNFLSGRKGFGAWMLAPEAHQKEFVAFFRAQFGPTRLCAMTLRRFLAAAVEEQRLVAGVDGPVNVGVLNTVFGNLPTGVDLADTTKKLPGETDASFKFVQAVQILHKLGLPQLESAFLAYFHCSLAKLLSEQSQDVQNNFAKLHVFGEARDDAVVYDGRCMLVNIPGLFDTA